MRASDKIRFDAASGLLQGKRDLQEDALASDFPIGSDSGFAVLSDGMGGHKAGDIASNIVVNEVFQALETKGQGAKESVVDISSLLFKAAHLANERLRQHSEADPSTSGMGATLIATFLVKQKLFWISIGDSPLFLFRDKQLTQLNEDHSLAPQIDFMVESGLLSETAGRDHPDRNCLISALMGEDIPQIDCPKEPFDLRFGDLIIAASDGLQFLRNDHIECLLAEKPEASSAEIAELLLSEISALDDPFQDNVTISLVRVVDPSKDRSGQHASPAKMQGGTPDLGSSISGIQPKLGSVPYLFSFFDKLRFSVFSSR